MHTDPQQNGTFSSIILTAGSCCCYPWIDRELMPVIVGITWAFLVFEQLSVLFKNE